MYISDSKRLRLPEFDLPQGIHEWCENYEKLKTLVNESFTTKEIRNLKDEIKFALCN